MAGSIRRTRRDAGKLCHDALALLHSRDERLLHRLREQMAVDQGTGKTIAVVYGAGHIRAVVRELATRQGYMTGTSDWLTVFHL